MNTYLILTPMECLILRKHTLKILCKSKHFPRRYKRKREWVFFSEHSVYAATDTMVGCVEVGRFVDVSLLASGLAVADQQPSDDDGVGTDVDA